MSQDKLYWQYFDFVSITISNIYSLSFSTLNTLYFGKSRTLPQSKIVLFSFIHFHKMIAADGYLKKPGVSPNFYISEFLLFMVSFIIFLSFHTYIHIKFYYKCIYTCMYILSMFLKCFIQRMNWREHR